MTATLAKIASFQSLLAAFGKARRAKRGKGGEPEFYRDLEANLLRLSADLAAETWRPQPYRFFHIWHGKDRVVSEAAFADRVVHHALVGALEPLFEPGFIDQSYACRTGKGAHAAVDQAHALARSGTYFLKLDIRRYFDHISYAKLLELLAKRVEDPAVLRLCSTIMAGAHLPHLPDSTDRGLPIGNLTSQFWANVYLDPLDHLAEAMLGRGNYLRYMDDMLGFANTKAELWEFLDTAKAVVEGDLHLTLKAQATILGPVTEGIRWLGHRVFPGTIRLDHASRRRFARKLSNSAQRLEADPDQALVESARASSLCAHVGHANSLRLRQAILTRQQPEFNVVRRLSGSNRVKRGGSFDNNNADNLRSSKRNDDNPSDDDNNLGFRCSSSRKCQNDGAYGRRRRAKGPMTSAPYPGRLRPDEESPRRPEFGPARARPERGAGETWAHRIRWAGWREARD
jgi:RNA-directed DNA polymerase